jgi:TonB family protein
MEKRANVGSLVLRNLGSSIADSARYVVSSLGLGFKEFPLVSRNMGKSVISLVTNRDLGIGFGSGVLLLFLLFLLFMPKQGSRVKEYELTEQVTLLDQSYPPQASKVVPRAGLFDGEVSTENLPSGLADAQPIDLGRKIDRNQVAVNLDRYAPAGAITDVIRISKRGEGGGLTTEEILAQAPISLRRAAPQGGAGQMGLIGFQGIGGGVGKPIDIGSAPTVRTAPQAVSRAQTGGNQAQVPTGQTPSRASFTVAGPLKGRAIVAKAIPEYPEWARARGLTDVQIAMRLEVTPDGTVRTTIILERSSGYPQWDQSCMSALAQWRFAPLPADVQQEVQWGIITFIFRLMM